MSTVKLAILIFLVIVCSYILLTAFQLPKSIDQKKMPVLVKEKLDEEIRNYYAERMRICKLEALTRAEDYVDSIIENKINLVIAKGIYFPNRPVKPGFPAEIKLDDTTVIAPVLKDIKK